VSAEEIVPTGDEHAQFDVRWRRFALAVLDGDNDRVMAAFLDLEKAGRWTVAMMLTGATRHLIDVVVEEDGAAAARAYFEHGLFWSAVGDAET
jgi:hypothetical protein